MPPAEMIATFTERFPFVGPAFWIVSVQYYIVQLVGAAAWNIVPYSWRFNTISDLGNTVCGQYGERFVCSPLHGLMNLSLIVLGITMIIGAVLIYQEFKETTWSLLGFSLMAVAGIGTLLVGFFPENTNNLLHIVGAGLPFLLGNLALLVFGIALDIPKWLRTYTLISGIIALLALPLFLNHVYFGLGVGGMERIVAYPQTMWLIAFGVYISHSHMRASKK